MVLGCSESLDNLSNIMILHNTSNDCIESNFSKSAVPVADIVPISSYFSDRKKNTDLSTVNLKCSY